MSNPCGIPIEVGTHTGRITIIKKMLLKNIFKYYPAGVVQEFDSARILPSFLQRAREAGRAERGVEGDLEEGGPPGAIA